MSWLAVDKDGTNVIFDKKPIRYTSIWQDKPFESTRINDFIVLPSSTIFRLIGRELSWEDEPVELTETTLVKAVEVSDDEIEDTSYIQTPKDMALNLREAFADGWYFGAKWMLERIKK